MSYEHISDLFESVRELVVSQYKDSTNLLNLVSTNVKAFQSIEDASKALINSLDVSNVSGLWLDLIGKIRGINRNSGETDSNFRLRLNTEFNRNNAGSVAAVFEISKKLSNSTNIHYLEESPATFFIYTPDGSQIKQSSFNDVAPAGVLGLPGAAIQFADGSFMGDYGKKKVFLAVADE